MKPNCPTVVHTFFSLLRSGLYGIPVPVAELPSRIDWEGVMRLAGKHAVAGTIIESVQFLPEALRPSAQMEAKMHGFALKLIKSNMRLDRSVAQIVNFFESHGIQGVLLKGQGIARSYRLPQMRQTGDIDFYVGASQYARAVELCRRHLIKGKEDEYEESSQHFCFRHDGVVVEVHRIATEIYSTFRKSRFENWIIHELEHSPRRQSIALADGRVTLPSADFNAVYIFYHALRHFLLEGIGLRQLCDWAMVFHTHSGEISYRELEKNVCRFGLTRGWKLFASIAVDYLGVPSEKIPLYDPSFSNKSLRLLDAIISGGNFGFYAKINDLSPTSAYGIKYTVAKARYLSRYFFHTFPILPLESASVYLYRLLSASKTALSSLARKVSNR